MGIIETEGIITREVKYGESDRILTIISKDFGKISAIANNVRRNKSGLLAGTQLFCYNKFTLFHGREKSLYKINSAEIIQPFKNLRESLEHMAYASYFCDITNFFIHENAPDAEMLSLLLNTLYMLDNDKFSYEKLKAIFEFRTLSIAGFSPNIKKCVHCGTSENPGYLNLNDGVLLCKNCGNGLKNLIPINQTIIDAIYYISNIDMKHLYSFILSDEAINYLSIVGERYLETQSAHSYTTLEYLKKVINLT